MSNLIVEMEMPKGCYFCPMAEPHPTYWFCRRWCGDENNEWCVLEEYKCPLWNEDRMIDECKEELMRAAADAYEAAEKRIAELEAQMPKEAHWVAVQNGIGVCSNCNRQDSIDNMATHCRYCGARMKGEHDE